MARFLSFIVIIALLVGGGAFIWYGYKANPGVQEIDPEIEAKLAQLRQLKNIRLDVAILKDESFRSLISAPPVPGVEPLYRTGAVPPSPSVTLSPGRQNPFAPF